MRPIEVITDAKTYREVITHDEVFVNMGAGGGLNGHVHCPTVQTALHSKLVCRIS